MFTYGFYNSRNGDRKYNAEQMSSIFDGIIEDGVYSNVGEVFAVIPGTGLQVIVKTGRAWFDHTWNLNDSWLPLSLDVADPLRPRIDSVVIEVNSNLDTRENALKIVKGAPAMNPVPPTMIHADGVNQYRLANVTVQTGAKSIEEADIANTIGQDDTPFVIAPLKSVDISDLFNQWNGEFDAWFDNVKAQLEGNVVTNLQKQIDEKIDKSDIATESDIQNGVGGKIITTDVMLNGGAYSLIADVGDVLFTERDNLGSGWLPCDGAPLNISAYPKLASVMKLEDSIVGNGETVKFNDNANGGPWIGALSCDDIAVIYGQKIAKIWRVGSESSCRNLDISGFSLDYQQTGRMNLTRVYTMRPDRLILLYITSASSLERIGFREFVGDPLTADATDIIVDSRSNSYMSVIGTFTMASSNIKNGLVSLVYLRADKANVWILAAFRTSPSVTTDMATYEIPFVGTTGLFALPLPDGDFIIGETTGSELVFRQLDQSTGTISEIGRFANATLYNFNVYYHNNKIYRPLSINTNSTLGIQEYDLVNHTEKRLMYQIKNMPIGLSMDYNDTATNRAVTDQIIFVGNGAIVKSHVVDPYYEPLYPYFRDGYIVINDLTKDDAVYINSPENNLNVYTGVTSPTLTRGLEALGPLVYTGGHLYNGFFRITKSSGTYGEYATRISCPSTPNFDRKAYIKAE